MNGAEGAPRLPRSMHFAVFALGLLWLLASQVGAESAARGITGIVHAELLRPLMQRCFFLVLLLAGFTALNGIVQRGNGVRAANALPERATAGREWQNGAALGWGLLLLAVLPAMLVGDLKPYFWFAPRALGLFLLSLATVLVGSLATEVAFRGFLFQRLIATLGRASGTLVMVAIYGVLMTPRASATMFSFAVSLALAALLSLAYLRTHGLWLGWGLRFGWLASMGVLLGLPTAGSTEIANLVATESSGKVWLSGGSYGPEGALFSVFVLLGGLFALYRLSREYAWEYTFEPIVPGGYPMDVAAPAAHAAMAAAAPAPPPPLVQIQTEVPWVNSVPFPQAVPPPPRPHPEPPPRAGAGVELAPGESSHDRADTDPV